MNNAKLVTITKHSCFVLLFLFFYVLQSTPRLFVIAGIKPMLLVAAAISVAMFEGEFVGGIYGAFAGLLCDTLGYTLFGYNGFMLCIICVCVGLLVNWLMQPTVFVNMLYTFVGLIIILSVSFLFTYGIWRLSSLGQLFLRKVLLVSIYTALMSPVFYYFFRFLHQRFDKAVKRYTRIRS